MTCYRTVTAIKNHPGMGGFPDRELTNLSNVGGAWKGIQCCVLLFRRSVTHRFSQFVKCQNSMGNTQVLCFLILFAEDADLDKVLRRYMVQILRSGALRKVPKVHSMLPQFGMRGCVCAIFMMQFCILQKSKVSTTQGAYW